MFRKLPIAFDRDIKTSVGDAKGPNVMTGYEDGEMRRIVDSFLKSICSSTAKDHQTDHYKAHMWYVSLKLTTINE